MDKPPEERKAEISRINAELRIESGKLGRRALAAIESARETVADAATNLDASRTRRSLEDWKQLVRKSAVYVRWVETGKVSAWLATQLMKDDLLAAGFDVDAGFVFAWQRRRSRGVLAAVELSLPVELKSSATEQDGFLTE